LDCCYSGSWIDRLFEYGDFYDVLIQGSSTPKQKSNDLGLGKGSLFTNFFISSNIKNLVKDAKTELKPMDLEEKDIKKDF
jgi:hypothetical protein